jgi:hypothetical protein
VTRAGGGSAGAFRNGATTPGTPGGGGASQGNSTGENGGQNQGGGGGGGQISTGNIPQNSGNGGSGQIILRFPTADAPRVSVSPGTNTVSPVSPTESIATFTVSGTLTLS